MTESQVKQIISNYFEQNDYNYKPENVKDSWVLYSGFNNELGVVFTVKDNDINVVARSFSVVEYSNAIAEFMLRLNRYLKRGHYFYDYNTNTINYKMWESTRGKLDIKDIDEMVKLSVSSIESILPVINKVISGDSTPADAVKAYVQGANE